MFEVIKFFIDKLLGILPGIFKHYDTKNDIQIGKTLLELNQHIQDIYLAGTKILQALINNNILNVDRSDFLKQIETQVVRLHELKEKTNFLRSQLSTIAPDLFMELTPLIDSKSGILTKIEQEFKMSPYSSTTIFFLSYDEIEQYCLVFLKKEKPQHFIGNKTFELRKFEISDVILNTSENTDKLKFFLEKYNATKQLEDLKNASGMLSKSIDNNIGLAKIRHGH